MNMVLSSRKTVSRGRKAAYAAPAFSLAAIGIPLYIYLPKFYTDVVGVDIALLGTIILAVRVFDGITDPLLGFISDRTRTRFGRRRPYIALFSILLAALVFALYNPPEGSPQMAAWWFGTVMFSLTFCWTAVDVPWEALGPEITFDYHERTEVFAIRDGLQIAGILVAAASPALISRFFGLPPTAAGERDKFFYFAVIYSPLVVLSCWWCVLALKEIASRPALPGFSLGHVITPVLKNKPFLILLVSYTVSALGANLPATLILYYVEYVLRSAHAELFLLVYLVTGIVFLPGWVALASKIEKKTAWLSAMSINTGAFIGVFFLGAGDETAYVVMTILSGIGFGATVALPSSMQADVIDYDELLSGQRREGLYIGIWAISKKLASAAGIGIALSLIGFSGYKPNMEQDSDVVFMLRVLYALLPALCNIAAIIIALSYPISSGIHDQIKQAVSDRKAFGYLRDPLNPVRDNA